MKPHDMSLEDIIKKKNTASKRPRRPPTGKMEPVKRNFDARNKLINKNRREITDARDRLAQLSRKTDARFKLEEVRKRKAQMKQPPFHPSLLQHKVSDLRRTIANVLRAGVDDDIIFKDARRQVQQQPFNRRKPQPLPGRHISNSLRIESRLQEQYSSPDQYDELIPARSLRRTVRNDFNKRPSLPLPLPEVMDIDDEEDLPILSTGKPKNLKIVARNDFCRKGETSDKRATSSPVPPSILKKKPTSSSKEKASEKQYRIIVSNLGDTVTESDIQELFADVGGLLQSRLVRPGTAEVIYGKLEDAEKAVSLYHNRQLDGQPMNCFLINPKSNLLLGAKAGNTYILPASSNSNVVPDISTFHKVLFAKR